MPASGNVPNLWHAFIVGYDSSGGAIDAFISVTVGWLDVADLA